MIISLYANKLGLSIRGSEILQKWLWLESIRVILWKTWLESSPYLSQRDSSRFRVTKNRDSGRVIDSSHAITDFTSNKS